MLFNVFVIIGIIVLITAVFNGVHASYRMGINKALSLNPPKDQTPSRLWPDIQTLDDIDNEMLKDYDDTGEIQFVICRECGKSLRGRYVGEGVYGPIYHGVCRRCGSECYANPVGKIES